ncbi:MAG: chemotaxis protein methyltransferase CheR [Desulfobacteraceae bacterium Eth-SRB1]|nr:MAG: chemotaxis protein methyltransferase CheR [Desulfobacteraceae bacterium Eth-SRB1]
MTFTNDQAFHALWKRIFKERGLDLSQYREKCLKRRIDVRLRATGVDTYMEYMVVLKRDPSEYDRLFDVLTINVTDFFRDSSTYRIIEDKVIPELVSLKKKQGKKIIRVWSAACATGEEPYSIAILFHEILRDRIDDFLISIYATDIDEKVMKKAKKGEYEAGSVSKVDEKILRRYFNCNLKYNLKEEIKQMVRFKRHDLISDRPLVHLDIILCRNVLIYFSRDQQVKLFDKFYEALNRGGYLILGKTESLAGKPAGLFQPVSIRERIYRKK